MDINIFFTDLDIKYKMHCSNARSALYNVNDEYCIILQCDMDDSINDASSYNVYNDIKCIGRYNP